MNIDTIDGTLLHFAILNGVTRLPIYNTLLDFDTTILNKRGNFLNMTPLLLAARLNKQEIFDILFKYCRNISPCDIYGNSILHLVMKNGWIENVKDILRKNCSLLDTRNLDGQQ